MKITLTIILCLLLHASAGARTWTAKDGRKLDAEFVSATEEAVTVQRAADRMKFTIPLDSLSEADQKFVREKLAEMNQPKPLPEGPFTARITGDWQKAESKSGLPFQIFGSPELDGAKVHPLVVCLHGINERGTNNEGQLDSSGARFFAQPDRYEKRPCFIVAPQCPPDLFWSGAPADDVIEMIEELGEALPIDEDRIYILGYSMGGYGVWSLLGKEPDLFAAAVPIAGGGNPSDAREMKNVPIWAFHGDKDDVVKVEETRKMVEALEKARANYKYTEFPGAGHGVLRQSAEPEETQAWMFAQKRGS